MKVFKFGGASVYDAKGIRNIVDIIANESDNLLVVISAMGKMTNAFENLINAYFSNDNYTKELQFITDYHNRIIADLNIESCLFNEYLSLLEDELKQKCSKNYHYEYDRLIGYGELFSTIIVWVYMRQNIGRTNWVDIRDVIKTDSNYRFAKVNWEKTLSNIQKSFDFSKKQIFLTQGFIASDLLGKTTSLGREGSDYSAAILSYGLNADSITIWKDVEGVLDGDPRLFKNAKLIEHLSFYDAIELAFFGAQIIHPKTIQPLKNKKIPLHVKSFKNPENKGTLVSEKKANINSPIVIIKDKQVLLSITSRDFSFVNEENISSIFQVLSKYNVKVNLMQNGAVSFSVAVDYLQRSFSSMIHELSENFDIRYNSNLKLVTIRHYTNEKIAELIENKKIYLEQKSRNTAQFLLGE